MPQPYIPLQKLGDDMLHEVSRYLDGSSIQNMAGVWPPMANLVLGPNGSISKYQIELDNFQMVEDVIPESYRSKSTKELRDMLLRFNFRFSSLYWAKFDTYTFPRSSAATSFIEDTYSEIFHNPRSFIGQSGGWLYHATQSHVDMIRPMSIRNARQPGRQELDFPCSILAFAVDHGTGITAALNFTQGIATIHVQHPTNRNLVFPPRTWLAPNWDSDTVRPVQFEICGNFIAVIVSQIGVVDDAERWIRQPVIVMDWTTGQIVFSDPHTQSFQFLCDKTIVMLGTTANPRCTLRVFRVDLIDDKVYTTNVRFLPIHRDKSMVESVTFVIQATPPSKTARNDGAHGYVHSRESPKEISGPFRTDPAEQLIGLRLEYHYEIKRRPDFLVYDLKYFMAPRFEPLFCETIGFYPALSGKRLIWSDSRMNPVRVCMQDFNPNAHRMFGNGTKDRPHPENQNWCMNSWVTTKPEYTLGVKTYMTTSVENNHRDNRLFLMEDNLVLMKRTKTTMEVKIYTF